MSKSVYLVVLLLAVAINSSLRANDDIEFADVKGFLLRQPYRIIAFKQYVGWAIAQEQFTEQFFTATINICSSEGLSRDSTALFHSLIEIDSLIIFTYVPVAGDSTCIIRDVNGKALQVLETDSPIAPTTDFATSLAERISQYGLTMQQYNRLRASRKDPGGYTQLGLSVALVALGVYGLVEGDEGGKITGGLAVLASPFAIVGSVRQIGEDRRREKQISELTLKLKLGF
ncbi:MAG: hypothetical protein PHN52_13670 [candidate division Zixibacteria bacterium]|nr:hypothetical protein [candidate division Zixibacteria bacterium]